MDRLGLARQLQRNEALALRAYLLADVPIRRRFGFELSRCHGLLCLSSARLDDALYHRAIGLGVSGDATAAAIDAVTAHFARRGRRARIEVADGVTPLSAVRLLERMGFRPERGEHIVHALVTDRPVAAPRVRGLRVAEIRRSDHRTFGALARVGFEASGERADLVERTSTSVFRHALPRFIGYIGWLGDRPVATGALCLAMRAGGLYSDTTLPGYRGRGIQKAMIAARVERGLARGIRVFTARTEGLNTSARNYAATGFVPLYHARFYARDP
ncbi:MAG TPA: hypothetical protein VFM93_12100 [Candidatus Limnocylindria bacterium]|nr:hypothetical protein [Candidatus Limnocylindria bacterium]